MTVTMMTRVVMMAAMVSRGENLISPISTKARLLYTTRPQVSKPVEQRITNLLNRDAQSFLKPLGYKVPMAVPSTSLNIYSVHMAKKHLRGCEREQMIPNLDRIEGIQNVAKSAQIFLGGNGFEPRSRFKVT